MITYLCPRSLNPLNYPVFDAPSSTVVVSTLAETSSEGLASLGGWDSLGGSASLGEGCRGSVIEFVPPSTSTSLSLTTSSCSFFNLSELSEARGESL